MGQLECERLCNLHRPPASSTAANVKGNSSTHWSKPTPLPVLSMVDAGTKLMAARLLYSEPARDMIRLCMGVGDIARSWASDVGMNLEACLIAVNNGAHLRRALRGQHVEQHIVFFTGRSRTRRSIVHGAVVATA